MKTQQSGRERLADMGDAGRRGVQVAAAVGVLAVGAAGAASMSATSAEAAEPAQGPVACAVQPAQTTPASLAFVKVHNVQGTFSYSQDVVTPTEQITHDLKGVGHVLSHADAPAAPSAPAPADPLDWHLSVAGLVDVPFVASLRELAREGASSAVMSYTCMNNPADGRATANADTTGVTLASMLRRAGVRDGANVVTFVSADGYEISLPLPYVTERAAMIAYRLNGEPLARSIGCTNQLWLAGASAHYFVRDVETIRISKVGASNVPPIPGSPASGDQFRNRPNVGVLGGYSIA